MRGRGRGCLGGPLPSCWASMLVLDFFCPSGSLWAQSPFAVYAGILGGSNVDGKLALCWKTKVLVFFEVPLVICGETLSTDIIPALKSLSVNSSIWVVSRLVFIDRLFSYIGNIFNFFICRVILGYILGTVSKWLWRLNFFVPPESIDLLLLLLFVSTPSEFG